MRPLYSVSAFERVLPPLKCFHPVSYYQRDRHWYNFQYFAHVPSEVSPPLFAVSSWPYTSWPWCWVFYLPSSQLVDREAGDSWRGDSHRGTGRWVGGGCSGYPFSCLAVPRVDLGTESPRWLVSRGNYAKATAFSLASEPVCAEKLMLNRESMNGGGCSVIHPV